jgi:hypothetical protein
MRKDDAKLRTQGIGLSCGGSGEFLAGEQRRPAASSGRRRRKNKNGDRCGVKMARQLLGVHLQLA